MLIRGVTQEVAEDIVDHMIADFKQSAVIVGSISAEEVSGKFVVSVEVLGGTLSLDYSIDSMIGLDSKEVAMSFVDGFIDYMMEDVVNE